MHSAKLFFAATLLLAAATDHAALRSASKWIPIRHEDLCVTDGSIGETAEHRLTVDVPKMRAVATIATSQDIEAHFTYDGGSATETPLASGTMRRQFGFKLLAQDPCNLVYAMWRIEPRSEIVVSIKSNPGQHTSAECTNHGYHDVKPTRDLRVPAVELGSRHALRAEISGDDLRVYADDKLVWQGLVGSLAAGFRGPVGIRSDNVKLDLDLRAGEAKDGQSEVKVPCAPDPGEND